MKPRWRSYFLYASAVIAVGGLLYILIETVRLKNTGFETKTLWDWMELLIIPLFLTAGAIAVNRSEKKLEQQRAEEHARLEREIATDRQQEAALQAYLDRMADLLLKENLQAAETGVVRDVARVRTLTVLRGLDPTRKGIVVRFLYEAGLIYREKPIVELIDPDLSGAYLPDANLQGAALQGANLQHAKLNGTRLQSANLKGADLRGANLRNANLLWADLQHAILHGADLHDTDLQEAILSMADLKDADLRGANLLGAKLYGANLEAANLRGAVVTDKQLAVAKSLKAIRPDGTQYKKS